MTRYTSIGYLPGHYLRFFDNERVLCTWKGHPDYTLLYFFEAPISGGESGRCRDLLCLEIDYVVSDVKEAERLAKHSWDNYKEEILAGKGERMSVGPRGLQRIS